MDVKSEIIIKDEELDFEYDSYEHDPLVFPNSGRIFALPYGIKIEESDHFSLCKVDEILDSDISDDDGVPDEASEINTIYDSNEHVEYIPHEEEDSSDEDSSDEDSSDADQLQLYRPASRRRIEVEKIDPSNFIHKLKDGDYYGKNNHVWSTRPMLTGGRSTSQLRTHYSSKPRNNTMGETSEIECLALFFDNVFFKNLVKFTNKYIDKVAPKYSRNRKVQPIDVEEMKAFVGILIISGVRNDNSVPTSEMWHQISGYNLYRAGMSEGRFNLILRCLRFDDLDTRVQRQTEDKFAPIRDLWGSIISKCTALYEPGTYITVDEQLLGFRGRCLFRQYIANKPAKYGIKLVIACDAETKYVLNAMPYLGAHTKPPKGMMLGEFFTTELVKPYFNTQRSVTTDNWFTSHSLALFLLEKKMTLCGTLRKKPFIPEEMLNVKSMKKGTAAFLYDEKTTLVSYKGKEKKIVLLLSSEHNEGKVGKNNKPEIVNHYKKTKGGVDTLDQMCAKYSCRRKTKRWPLCVFYGIINIVVTNAYIIYKHKAPQSYKRRAFMHKVGFELIKENATRRFSAEAVPRNVKTIISELFNIRRQATVGPHVLQKRARCKKCPRKEDRKTKSMCFHCKTPVCERHVANVCHDCLQ